MKPKTLFALDFDGVICNSAVETAITSWKAAQSIWPDMQEQSISDKNIEQFRLIRPCLEIGYEAILIMRLLQQEIAMSEVCKNYQQQLQTVLNESGFSAESLQDLFGKTRDRNIQENEAAWIASNPLFEGIAKKLKTLKQEDWFIVTTKQERFVNRILQGNEIQFDEKRIFGLERKLNKQTVLKQLKNDYPDRSITFIEDRMPTLVGVLENPELSEIKLQLVDWGYNTEIERKSAVEMSIEVIEKENFLS